MFKGVFTALITPFRNGRVDEIAFQKFVEWQIAEGIHGLVPCGTTGESPTLSHEEHMRVVELCIEAAAGRVPVIAGAGSNSTDEAIELTRHAQQAGADAVLSVVPYYNKPTQEGLYQHFKAIHDATDVQIILYNIPGRSVVQLTDETIARLARLPNIVGVKDATGDLARPASLRNLLEDEFCQLSGEDATAVAFNAMGGDGCISVTSNIAPHACAEVQNRWFCGDVKEAQELSDRLFPIHNIMFIETSPAPVKYAASLMGLCTPEVRLPLVEASDATKVKVRDTMQRAGLLDANGKSTLAHG